MKIEKGDIWIERPTEIEMDENKARAEVSRALSVHRNKQKKERDMRRARKHAIVFLAQRKREKGLALKEVWESGSRNDCTGSSHSRCRA